MEKDCQKEQEQATQLYWQSQQTACVTTFLAKCFHINHWNNFKFEKKKILIDPSIVLIKE